MGIFGAQVAPPDDLYFHWQRQGIDYGGCYAEVHPLVPLIYILPHLCLTPTMGVYLAEPVADVPVRIYPLALSHLPRSDAELELWQKNPQPEIDLREGTIVPLEGKGNRRIKALLAVLMEPG